MFTNASSKVSIGFTNITAGMVSLAPNQLLILNGVNTNLISRPLHNVLTNFLLLRSVMMEKGPMYGNLKYKQLPLRATL